MSWIDTFLNILNKLMAQPPKMMLVIVAVVLLLTCILGLIAKLFKRNKKEAGV